ncbi:MAG: MFS transporter [Planctomycetaceae bacterium]
MTDNALPDAPRKPRRGPLLIIFITVFIDLLGFGIVLPLLPRYGKAFQADDLTLGLLMASFSAMQFVFAPIWGRVSDRVGRRPILILGLAGSTAFYALFGFATSLGADATWLGLGAVPWLFISRMGAGIAGATIPTAQAYIADVTGERERGKGMALIGAAFGIGFTFGPLIGAAFVSDKVGAPPSEYPGYVAAVLSGIAMLCAIFVLPESLRKERSAASESHWFALGRLRKAVGVRGVGLILLTMFLTTFAFGQLESTLSLLTKEVGMDQRNNFYVFSYIGFILMISQGILVRRLLPRFGEFNMGLTGTLLMAAGMLLVARAGETSSQEWLFVVLPVSVLGFSALSPSLQALLSLRTAESEQGGILGVGQSISALARIVGPAVGIPLFGLGISVPYWTGAGLMGFGVLLVLALRTVAVSPADSSRQG